MTDESVLSCRFCGRVCKSAMGLKSHETACKKKAEGNDSEAAPQQKDGTSRKIRKSSGERWPGKCRNCGSDLECYARTASASLMKRTKYIRCVKKCGFKTQIFEEIRGPLPRPPVPMSPRPQEATTG